MLLEHFPSLLSWLLAPKKLGSAFQQYMVWTLRRFVLKTTQMLGDILKVLLVEWLALGI